MEAEGRSRCKRGSILGVREGFRSRKHEVPPLIRIIAGARLGVGGFFCFASDAVHWDCVKVSRSIPIKALLRRH